MHLVIISQNSRKSFTRLLASYSFVFLFFSYCAQAQYDSLTFDDVNRTYLLHLPDGYTGENDLSLIIALHGGFGSANNLQNQSGLSDLADEEDFIVVYPEGVPGPLNIRTWNAGVCCGSAINMNIDDVGYIEALLDTLSVQYAIDLGRVYATGISNGGYMSYRLACEMPNRIAAIAPVASSMSPMECSNERPVPVISFHSYLDTNIPHLGGMGDGISNHENISQDSIRTIWNSLNNCSNKDIVVTDNDQYTYIKSDNCDCQVELNHYITRDGGHSWPGGQRTIIGDPVSEFIDANELMWGFFKRYSTDCNLTTSTENQNEIIGHFYLFPNPAKDEINIRLNGLPLSFKVTIYDQRGQVALEIENKAQFPITNLSSGIYLVKIQSADFCKINRLIVSE